MTIEDLLPLRGAALLVETIESSDAEGAVCRARVPPASPFAEDGRVPAFVGLEIAAQAAGAHGMLGHRGPPPPAGYLVLIRDVRLHCRDFAAGEALTAEVKMDGTAPPLALYRFRVARAAGAVAEGLLGTFVPS